MEKYAPDIPTLIPEENTIIGPTSITIAADFREVIALPGRRLSVVHIQASNTHDKEQDIHAHA